MIGFDRSGSVADLARLDRRLTRIYPARVAATAALVLLLGALTGIALLTRSEWAARAARIAAPSIIAVFSATSVLCPSEGCASTASAMRSRRC